jgi:hypothetical protein
MSIPPELRVTGEDGRLRVEWDNRAIEKDGCIVPFFGLIWFMWAPSTLWMTCHWVVTVFDKGRDADPGTVCVMPVAMLVGWFITLWIPRVLLSRNWLESVEVTSQAITHTRKGRLAPAPEVYPLAQVDTVAFGWDRDKPDKHPTDDFKNAAIYIVLKDRRRSSGIAEWLQAKQKYHLFQLIQRYLAANESAVKTVVWGEPEPWVKW